MWWRTVVNTWVGLGIFFLGAAAGALLTAIAFQGQIQRLRSESESQIADRQKAESGNGAKITAA
jgi:hypothetical protein